MRESRKVQKWVVYETLAGPKIGMRSVCTTEDWKVVEARDPMLHRIIREDITDETEAEKLARGTSGDLKSKAKPIRPKFE